MNTADQAIHENKIRLKFIFCRYRIKNKTLFLFYVYGDKAEDLLASISKGLVPIQLNWIGLFWIVFSLSEQGSSASVISIYCKMPSALWISLIKWTRWAIKYCLVLKHDWKNLNRLFIRIPRKSQINRSKYINDHYIPTGNVCYFVFKKKDTRFVWRNAFICNGFLSKFVFEMIIIWIEMDHLLYSRCSISTQIYGKMQ